MALVRILSCYRSHHTQQISIHTTTMNNTVLSSQLHSITLYILYSILQDKKLISQFQYSVENIENKNGLQRTTVKRNDVLHHSDFIRGIVKIFVATTFILIVIHRLSLGCMVTWRMTFQKLCMDGWVDWV